MQPKNNRRENIVEMHVAESCVLQYTNNSVETKLFILHWRLIELLRGKKFCLCICIHLDMGSMYASKILKRKIAQRGPAGYMSKIIKNSWRWSYNYVVTLDFLNKNVTHSQSTDRWSINIFYSVLFTRNIIGKMIKYSAFKKFV